MMKLLVLGMMVGCVAASEWKPLWDREAPGAARPPAGAEKIREGWRYTDIERPEYFLYPAPAEKRTGQGVVILPGGGYTILAMNHEGHDYAKWLNARGISAMVVKYRVSGDDAFGYRHPVPFLDARRAIRTMRSMAGELGLKSVGVMGSSAGGHLASVCVTRFGDVFDEEGKDTIDRLDCRPDFGILIYPVISMSADFSHGGSRRRLLGAEPSDELAASLSTEKQVGARTPPCFLLTTFDDGVDCRNSLRFAEACKAHKVPVSLHVFEKGGHGYGMNVAGKGDLEAWPSLLERWLASRG